MLRTLTFSKAATSFASKISSDVTGKVQAELVTFEQLFIAEAAKTLALLALVTLPRTITVHKIVKMGASEWIGTQGKIHVGAQIIDPELLCLWFGTGLALIKKEYVRFDALSIKDAGGNTFNT